MSHDILIVRKDFTYDNICYRFLIIGMCILLRVYPVMLMNHRTQQCFLVLVFIVV
jgi:hypothetical protein